MTCTQVSQETGNVFWYSHLFKKFPVCCDPHKGCSMVKEAEVDVFLEFPFFLYDSVDVGNLITGSSAFSKPSLYIWKFSAHVLLKPGVKNFECNLTSTWNKWNCTIVWKAREFKIIFVFMSRDHYIFYFFLSNFFYSDYVRFTHNIQDLYTSRKDIFGLFVLFSTMQNMEKCIWSIFLEGSANTWLFFFCFVCSFSF